MVYYNFKQMNWIQLLVFRNWTPLFWLNILLQLTEPHGRFSIRSGACLQGSIGKQSKSRCHQKFKTLFLKLIERMSACSPWGMTHIFHLHMVTNSHGKWSPHEVVFLWLLNKLLWPCFEGRNMPQIVDMGYCSCQR
jgi:hypothetical protein